MRKPANLLFLAIVIAALGSTLVYRYLNTQQAQLDAARAEARRSMETVDVVVAAHQIDVGARIGEDDVVIIQWPADSEPTGTLAGVDDAVGKIARANIARFQPIAAENLTDHRSGLLPLLIEQGKRAMSVRVDKETGVSGFITPNSYVDVLATGTVGAGGDREQRSKLILQNVKVMAIGKRIEIEDNEPVEVPTVTLLVSPEDAEKLTLATQQKPVQLALRHFEDGLSVETTGQSMDQLLVKKARVPEPAPEPVAVVHRQAPPARPSMEVLLGETMTRVAF
jgi:pilus assembly protein CpaB